MISSYTCPSEGVCDLIGHFPYFLDMFLTPRSGHRRKGELPNLRKKTHQCRRCQKRSICPSPVCHGEKPHPPLEASTLQEGSGLPYAPQKLTHRGCRKKSRCMVNFALRWAHLCPPLSVLVWEDCSSYVTVLSTGPRR